jgi:hypothetical protein
MNRKRKGHEDLDWIHLAQDRAQCRAVVKARMDLQVQQEARDLSILVSVSLSRLRIAF